MNKKWTYLGCLVIAALLGFYLFQKYSVAPEINFKVLPLENLNGEAVSMESFKGKKLVVCFSASWCGNCMEELQDVSEIKEEFLKDVEVLVIDDEPLEKIQRLKDRKGYNFTYLHLKQPFGSIGINSIPTSYLVNKEQKVKKEAVGYLNWKDPSTAKFLANLLN